MEKDEQIMQGLIELLNKWGRLNEFRMKEGLKGYKSSDVHYTEFIGENADSNLSELAQSLYMTRGAITKITRKLIEKKLIESYRKPDNKKEIYFRLTKQGEAVKTIHEKLHSEFRERDRVVFEDLSEEQLNGILDFVRHYSQHLDAEMEKPGAGCN